MSFRSLYQHVATLRRCPVTVEGHLVPKVKELTGQDDVFFTPVELDTGILLGYMKQYRVPTVPYGESRWTTDIRYHSGLNMCWRRYVCCKELMHTFDDDRERTNSPAKYAQLLSELESPPLPTDMSPMNLSENRTKWMALAVLCPMPVREHFRSSWQAERLSDYDVALELRIPELAIKTIMSDYFVRVVDQLTK
jgi:hypothetical protein